MLSVSPTHVAGALPNEFARSAHMTWASSFIHSEGLFATRCAPTGAGRKYQPATACCDALAGWNLRGPVERHAQHARHLPQRRRRLVQAGTWSGFASMPKPQRLLANCKLSAFRFKLLSNSLSSSPFVWSLSHDPESSCRSLPPLLLDRTWYRRGSPLQQLLCHHSGGRSPSQATRRSWRLPLLPLFLSLHGCSVERLCTQQHARK